MKEKEKKEIEKLYNSLDEKNKEILNMVAQGMKIVQDANIEKHIPHVD